MEDDRGSRASRIVSASGHANDPGTRQGMRAEQAGNERDVPRGHVGQGVRRWGGATVW